MAYTLSSPALHAAAAASRRTARGRCAARVIASATATAIDAETGIERARAGIKVAAEENALTPRFYTTDFEEMERMFSGKWNLSINQPEMEAMLAEFRADYNQKHFVRNDGFRAAADAIRGPARKIFIEFLERSCTAEFSGFLLYKELGRRLKATNATVAEIFTLMSRDEARHAGFINKAMSDFDLALDLGFLTKNRQYTFFKPKYILLATYLSEKIGYWRYISIYRHLQKNPDKAKELYPIFQYFENWCQDENRHGDFIAAMIKSQPDMVEGLQGRLWSRFFCLSVYITMYLNDHSRSSFYESLGLDTTVFNMHVLHQTNATTGTLFPEIIDTHNPQFKERLDRMVGYNCRLAEKGVNPVEKASLIARIGFECLGLFFMAPIRSGSLDLEPSQEASYVY